MTQLSLTYTLTPGANENVSHIQQNFQDIRDWANGNVDGTNITDGGVGTAELADDAVTTAKQATLPFARVLRSANQAIATGTLTPITFDTEEHDTNAMFAASDDQVNTPTAGYYIATATVAFASSVAGTASLLRYDSGGVSAATIAAAVQTAQTFNVSGADLFGANESVRFIVSQTSGGPVNATAYLTLSWVGPS